MRGKGRLSINFSPSLFPPSPALRSRALPPVSAWLHDLSVPRAWEALAAAAAAAVAPGLFFGGGAKRPFSLPDIIRKIGRR